MWVELHCWAAALKRCLHNWPKHSPYLRLQSAPAHCAFLTRSLLHAPTILPCSKAMLNFPLATYAADFSEAELDAIDARVAAGKPPPLTGTAGGQGQGPCGGCGPYDEHLFRHLE